MIKQSKTKELTVAYFSMEIGLESKMPTYAGGLGMLAADIMRSAADMGVQAACMTMGWQHGYLQQKINTDGTQQYSQINWDKKDFLERQSPEVVVQVEGRDVTIVCWKYSIESKGHIVPVYFLDTNLECNAEQDKTITNQLYGGDGAERLAQEVVLGIGGLKMLRALGYNKIGTCHMNEGHAAFLTLELLRENNWSNDAVKPLCAFTTHTPVKAGHDVFDYDLAYRIVGNQLPWHIREIAGQDRLSMTELALNLSRYTCGVAQIHGEVSRKMFPGYKIDAITNGVHHVHWASEPMRALFDTYIEGWRDNPKLLEQHGRDLPDEDLWNAHMQSKKDLLQVVNSYGHEFDMDHIIISSARRVVPYKRPELFYENLLRMKEICAGRIQIIHAGNAHPNDPFSQGVIQRMVERSHELRDSVKIAYLENYNPDLAKKLVSGSDIWLNTPMRLHEASGTSGMKACVNGVLNLSTLDGWWIEGYGMDPEAGWRIGPLVNAIEADQHRKIDAEDLYTQLQYEVIPEYYYKDRVRWIRRMKRSISLMGFFSSHRCVQDYVERAWNV